MASKVSIVVLAGLFLGFSTLYYFEKDPAQPTPATSSTPPVPDPAKEASAVTTASSAISPVAPIAAMGSFDRAPDGTPIPELPLATPKKIRLGVALFTYAGAQGVESKGRTRDAALEAAKKALASSAADFARLVQNADPGSAADVGWIKRGIIERRAESAVFLLNPGETLKEPVDTPRGFWVAKRLE